ncbi:MAG: DUF4392 domain-containing protein [Acidaminococcales bacterium]|jgi:hypothetical protein|nr:DUF4392 domain-containing protein [Acidaminococcales bacterium]
MEKEEALCRIGETLDNLMCADIAARGSIACLYGAARKLSPAPLTLGAAKILKNSLKAKDRVVLATGWIDQPEAAPGFGETDGPGGTLVLARALRQLCKAACVVVTDAGLVDGMKKVAQAAGFHCVAPDALDHSIERDKLMTLSILPFPAEAAQAKAAAVKLLDEINPSVCIAVERGGMNEEGRIHSMTGFDTSAAQAKIDYIFQEARRRKIKTLGIGDGGNEIGMANIKDCIRENIKYGRECLCPCRKGIAPATLVDYLLTAAVSNWGCYALAGMLAALCGRPDLAHTPEREERILKNAADSGFHDAMSGGVEYSVDGCELPVHTAMVALMRAAVQQGGR